MYNYVEETADIIDIKESINKSSHTYDSRFVNGQLVIVRQEKMGVRVYFVEKNSMMSYKIKELRSVSFNFPYISYVKGTSELWIHHIDDPLQIKRYLFEPAFNIVGVNSSSVKN